MRSSSIAWPGRTGLAAAAPLAVGLLLAVLLLIDQRARARSEADSAVRAVAATSVTQVRTEIRNELAAAPGQTSRAIVQEAQLATSTAATAVTARDTGSPQLADTVRPASIIVPVFRSGVATGTTAQRRTALIGYRVVPLTLQQVLVDLTPNDGGLVVRGPNRLVTADPAPAPADSRSYAVDMDLTGSPGWVVQAWRPAPGIPGVAWLWAFGVLAVFAAVAVAFVALLRREQVATSRRLTLERNRTMVTGLAPVLQASLDLGEVVPAVCSHLSDGLSLAGFSLSAPGDHAERQIFAWGTTPDLRMRPTTAGRGGLDPGETLAIGLTRGGRVLGVLRVVAGRPLGRDEIVALSTASELLGSTLANAETFARQQDLVERMRSVDELKTVFLATASHELRTPVTAIIGFSTLLLENWTSMPETQRRTILERVSSNGRRLGTLIEQLLDFSQLERGLPRPGDEALDLGATVQRILLDQPDLQTDHRVTIDCDERCVVRGSTSAVERIVTNLVGNAAKYSPAATRITITVRRDADRVLLLVDDEGSGVPADDREHVFSRFYRGRGDAVSRTRGAGIGLAIVAEYAASMSGTASVEEAPGGGARFRVSFPAVDVPMVPVSEGRRDVARS